MLVVGSRRARFVYCSVKVGEVEEGGGGSEGRKGRARGDVSGGRGAWGGYLGGRVFLLEWRTRIVRGRRGDPSRDLVFQMPCLL